MLSPATLLRKINITNAKSKPFRVVILGQNGVGKTECGVTLYTLPSQPATTDQMVYNPSLMLSVEAWYSKKKKEALTVRFLTRRYIGDYDPLLERVYTCQRTLDGISVEFEVWDTAGQNENNKLKEQIRWADAIILVYDVTDRCSFNECSRLKFLTNALSKRARKKSSIDLRADSADQLPVFLVGNKIDKEADRMVSEEEGETRSKQLGCVAFREVSVSEMVHEVAQVFEEIYVICKYGNKISLHFQLSASRHTLCVERPPACSSSDEDLAERDAISLPVTPESHVNVRDAIVSRKLRPEDVYKEMSLDDMWVKSSSKRREAMFMS